MTNETIIQEIIEGDLKTLWALFTTIKDEEPWLKQTYTKIKHGYTIKYHINWYLNNHYDERIKTREILCNGEVYPIEEWWDEIEQRETEARKTLLEYYEKESQPYI